MICLVVRKWFSSDDFASLKDFLIPATANVASAILIRVWSDFANSRGMPMESKTSNMEQINFSTLGDLFFIFISFMLYGKEGL